MKTDRLPQGADDHDRAKFDKLRDHLLRLDDEVTCKTCGKKFEIPSLHSLQFVDQIEGLPKDVEDWRMSVRPPPGGRRADLPADGRHGPGAAAGAIHATDQGMAGLNKVPRARAVQGGHHTPGTR